MTTKITVEPANHRIAVEMFDPTQVENGAPRCTMSTILPPGSATQVFYVHSTAMISVAEVGDDVEARDLSSPGQNKAVDESASGADEGTDDKETSAT